MKTRRHSTTLRTRAGFTLIELIGVLAIIAVLAAVVAPNALRSIERAAVRGEAESLHALGSQLKLYLRDQGTLPATATWTTALASYSDLSPTDLATNKRSNARVYLLDPATTPSQRAIFLSSMRAGLALPTTANINTAAKFTDIWQTADGSVPTATSWTWPGWSGVANSGDYLIIERVNLLPVYNTDLLPYTVSLNNHGAGTVSYNIVTAAGASGAAVNIAAGATVVLSNLHSRDRVNLYRAAAGVTLDYSYVLSSSGKTFDYNGTQWSPQ